jgi:drug/metabolite transporter (DMT)-like permease
MALVAAGLLWSLGGLFIKALTHHPAWHSSALGITFYRSLFAALCLLPLLRGRALPRAGDLAAAVTFYTLLLGLYVASTQGTTAANAIFLQYTAPLYAFVLGPLFFHEKFRREDAAALGVAMVGIAVLFFGNFRGGEQGPLLMGLGSGAMFGLFLLWLRRMRYADPVAVTALNNTGVAVLAGLLIATGLFPPWTNPAELALVPRALTGEPALLPVAALLVLMGCIQIAAPYVLFSYGLKRVPSVEASLLALVEPLLNPLWVVLFIGEAPTAATIAGGLLIILALGARYTFFRERGVEHER